MVKSVQLPHIQITIRDRVFTALWDSGASVSYVRQSTANHLEVEVKKAKVSQAKGADGSVFAFFGNFKAPVRIAGAQIEHSFLISADSGCPTNVLLGADFMLALELHNFPTKLELVSGRLHVGEDVIKLINSSGKAYKTTHSIMHVLAVEDVVLPPGVDVMVPVQNRNEIDEKKAVLMLPKKTNKIVFEKTIFHPLNGLCTTMIRMCNLTNAVIKIKKGKQIGEGEIVELDSAREVKKKTTASADVIEEDETSFRNKLSAPNPTMNVSISVTVNVQNEDQHIVKQEGNIKSE